MITQISEVIQAFVQNPPLTLRVNVLSVLTIPFYAIVYSGILMRCGVQPHRVDLCKGVVSV